METYWQQFGEALSAATAGIEDRYFRLAVAGQAEPAIRERAYCYELYHRLRLALPVDFPFALHGEVDKRGHPILGDLVAGRNPDFIVHMPGQMGAAANLGVVEVKSCCAFGQPVTKDADSLMAFVQRADYFRGVAVVFGGDEQSLDRHIRTVFRRAVGLRERVAIYWHHSAGHPAEPVPEWWHKIREGVR